MRSKQSAEVQQVMPAIPLIRFTSKTKTLTPKEKAQMQRTDQVASDKRKLRQLALGQVPSMVGDYAAMKSVVERILGKAAYESIKETTAFAPWKKAMVKVLDVLRLAIEENVKVVDDDWTAQVDYCFAHHRKVIRDTRFVDELFGSMAAALTEIAFLQLGHIPSVKARKTPPLSRGVWKLDEHRSVQYVQTPAQRAAQSTQKQR